MSTTIYSGTTVFTADPDLPTVEAFAVTDGRFSAVGSLEEIRKKAAGAREVNLNGFVCPGIIDSHTHLTMFGKALAKVQLRECTSVEQIQKRLVEARRKDPKAPRLLGMGWMFDAIDSQPTAAMLDAVLPDVPVYLDSNDFHSLWVNTAALREMGITDDTPDPIGGEVARDVDGHATGMLYESACIQYGWGYLDSQYTDEDIVRVLELAFSAYTAAGVTSVTEMSLDAPEVKGLRTLIKRDGGLPFPVSAHWLMKTTGDPQKDKASVAEVVALRDEIANSDAAPWLRVAGVKFIMDGVIDACTAAMHNPYVNGSNADPIWTAEYLLPAAAAADAAGLQIAMHAIGDRTSEIALDAVAHCVDENGERERRPRVEHLETVTPAAIERFAKLGVVASMQPVHCDPAVINNWKAMLGDARAEHGFPWHKFRAAGVAMTLGTDAPTAPHEPLPNLYIALTGGSALSPDLPPYHPERVFTPSEALTALTAGAAFAGGTEKTTGRVRVGLDASFVVLNVNPLEVEPRELLSAEVRGTFVRGRQLYPAAPKPTSRTCALA